MERLHLFAAIANPSSAEKYHRDMKKMYEDRANPPARVPLPQFVIEWTTMNDYWAPFDLSTILPLLESVEETQNAST